MQEKQDTSPTKEYYCIRPKPDCNSQKLKQCVYCIWFVGQIKRAKEAGIKEGKKQ